MARGFTIARFFAAEKAFAMRRSRATDRFYRTAAIEMLEPRLMLSDYYIAMTGSDSQAGSLDAPFATLGRFFTIAQPGDTCYIKGGTYNGSARGWDDLEPAVSGTADAPITVRNYAGQKVIIDTGRPSDYLTKFITLDQGQSYLTFRGLNLVHFEIAFNLQGTAPSHIVLSDLDIGYGGSYGTDDQDGWGVFMGSGVHDVTISGVVIHHIAGPGIQLQGGVDNVLIENCQIHDTTGGCGSDGIVANVADSQWVTNLTLIGNTVWNTDDDGIDIKGDSVTVTNCLSYDVAMCTYKFWSPPQDGVPLAQGRFTLINDVGFAAGETAIWGVYAPDMTITNCSFLDSGDGAFIYTSGQTWTGKLAMSGNKFYYNGNATWPYAVDIDRQNVVLSMDYDQYYNVNQPNQAFLMRTGSAYTVYSNGAFNDGAFYAAEGQELHGQGTVSPLSPVAENDSATTTVNTTFITPNVLKNDSDPNGEELSISGFTQGAYGMVVNNGDGTFTYTPAQHWLGTDSFTYTITDTSSLPATATVSVTVALPPPVIAGIASDTGVSTSDHITSDATLVFTGTASPNDTVVVVGVGLGIIGACTVDSSGNWTFDYSGTSLADGDYTFYATCADAYGHFSTSGTKFALTVDTEGPAVLATVINGGNSTRSYVRLLAVQFSEAMLGNMPTLALHNDTIGQDVDVSAATLAYDAPSHAFVWNLSAVNLPDGNYTATVHAAGATDLAGNVPAVTDQMISFFRLSGDVDGDGVVGGSDYVYWLRNFGTVTDNDFDGDSVMGGSDYALWLGNFGRTLAAISDGPSFKSQSNTSLIALGSPLSAASASAATGLSYPETARVSTGSALAVRLMPSTAGYSAPTSLSEDKISSLTHRLTKAILRNLRRPLALRISQCRFVFPNLG